MGNYRLTEDAKIDLRRIYRYGVDVHGGEQADIYFAALFDRFEALAESPLKYSETDIREGYRRSVCGIDAIYYRIALDGVPEIMAILSKQDVEKLL